MDQLITRQDGMIYAGQIKELDTESWTIQFEISAIRSPKDKERWMSPPRDLNDPLPVRVFRLKDLKSCTGSKNSYLPLDLLAQAKEDGWDGVS